MEMALMERKLLELLREIRACLSQILDALGGQMLEPKAHYLAWSAARINRIVGGYCELRERQMLDASKVMIRPVIEITLSAVAVFRTAGFLFQKAYSEYKEDLGLIKAETDFVERSVQDPEEKLKLASKLKQDVAAADEQFKEFETSYSKEFPQDPRQRQRLKTSNIVEAAQMPMWYPLYRLYCNFTHGALRATTGNLDEVTDPMDSFVMASQTLVILDQLKTHAPVEVADLKPWVARLHDLRSATQLPPTV